MEPQETGKRLALSKDRGFLSAPVLKQLFIA